MLRRSDPMNDRHGDDNGGQRKQGHHHGDFTFTTSRPHGLHVGLLADSCRRRTTTSFVSPRTRS